MATTSYTLSGMYPDGVGYPRLSVFHDTRSSPRVNGKLALVANPWSLKKVTSKRTNYQSGPAPSVYASFVGTTNDPRISRARSIAESELRAALARKIKNKEVGSLGVSLASAQQSIDMLRGSADQLTGILEAAERFYRTSRGKRRLRRLRRLINRGALPTAGLVLAGFFGWAPLLEDFSNACKTLANPWPPGFVSSKKHWELGTVLSSTKAGYYSQLNEWSASGHSAYSARVSVSNPNLWVANKLGLVNPFSVAWDLVPWSFAVNMFTNMGQIMGSLSDFAGVGLSQSSMTTKLVLSEKMSRSYSDPRPGSFSNASGTQDTLIRGRITGINPPGVTPYMRFPEWNLSMAAISGSLLIQQAGKLRHVLGDLFG